MRKCSELRENNEKVGRSSTRQFISISSTINQSINLRGFKPFSYPLPSQVNSSSSLIEIISINGACIGRRFTNWPTIPSLRTHHQFSPGTNFNIIICDAPTPYSFSTQSVSFCLWKHQSLHSYEYTFGVKVIGFDFEVMNQWTNNWC